MSDSTAKTALEGILNELPYDVILEYKFHSKRRFRIDYFIEIGNKGVAIEYEGGVWNRGRHTRPTGFINDCTKYNLATSMGLFVLRYTIKHLDDPDAVKQQILDVIAMVENGNN